MSSTVNRKQSFWKTVEATLRSILVKNGAQGITALTAEDAATWSRTIVLDCLVLQDLLPDGSRLRSDGNLKQWSLSIAKVDILTVARALKEFQLFIRNYPDEWAFLSYNDFKHRFPYGFTGDFWSPVQDVLLSYLADPNAATFQVLNHWVSFPLKLTLTGIAGDLTQKAEQEFLDNEARLSSLVLPDYDCDNIAAVIKEWFSGLSYAQDFRPHHSNGAVANRNTRDGLYGKYRNMKSDHRISTLYRKFGLNEAQFGFNQTTLVSSPLAKFITVPKGIDKRRTICPEPAEYQFNQQGVWDILDSYIQSSPILSSHIAIHDQSVNREAALFASKYQDAATIDLSSASDSVSWQLIKRVFRRSPILLWWLWSTRSTAVKMPSGLLAQTCKYAPMGSALCFPIESILFAAICQVAVNNTNCRARDTYHVYGDDIIIPTDAYLETCRLLTATGFLVNEQKTFYPYARFKESCGLEALDGIDVTCLGISRKFSADPLSASRPELVACYISFANELYSKGYVKARSFLLASILEMPRHLLPPFSAMADRGIRSLTATNWLANKRFNDLYQCEEIQVGCFSATLDPSAFFTDQIIFDRQFGKAYFDIKYHETLRRLEATKRSGLFDPDDLIQVSLRRAKLRLVSRWVPAWWFEDYLESPNVDPEVMILDGELLTFSSLLVRETKKWME